MGSDRRARRGVGPIKTERAIETEAEAEAGKLRLLFIGPMPPSAKSPNEVIGGARVMTARLAEGLRERGFDLDVVSTARPRPNLSRRKARWHELITGVRVFCAALRRMRRADAALLSISAYSAFIVGLIVWIIAAAHRKPMGLRLLGGAMSEVYSKYGPLRRRIADKTFLGRATVLVESRRLCEDLGNRPNVHWMANSRDVRPPFDRAPERPRRLAFVGQLRMAKGLGEALEACRPLPEGCSLSVYGPAMTDTDFSLFEGHPSAAYGGALEPADVPRVLAEHDLLLFPSYYRGEGYPGIIIEAMQCGLPVIAARWNTVPEVVEHEESGLLVAPRSVEELRSAINRLIEDPALYQRLRAGAAKRGEYLRSDRWHGLAADELRRAVAKRR